MSPPHTRTAAAAAAAILAAQPVNISMRRAPGRYNFSAMFVGAAVLGSLLLSLMVLPSSLPTAPVATECLTASQGSVTAITAVRGGIVANLLCYGSHARKKLTVKLHRVMSPSTTRQPDHHSMYGDQLVVRLNASSHAEARALRDAVRISPVHGDVWAMTSRFVDVQVKRDELEALLLHAYAATGTDSHEVLIGDLVAKMTATYPDTSSNSLGRSGSEGRPMRFSQPDPATLDDIFFQHYQPLDVVNNWMTLLQGMFPELVQLVTVGTSHEGREIRALRIGAPQPASNDDGPNHDKREEEEDGPRKTIVVTGGAHAREWISTTSVNYVAWSFVTTYGKVPFVTKILQYFDIVFVPTLNPDGMEHSWTGDRLWRKTRQPNGDSASCPGIDFDRNFGFEWPDDDNDPDDDENDPCSENFRGREAFESAEARSFAEWAKEEADSKKSRFVGLLDLHSYSQEVLYPFSFSCDRVPPNLENLQELGAGLVKAIRLNSGESYTLEAACEEGSGGELASGSAPTSSASRRSRSHQRGKPGKSRNTVTTLGGGGGGSMIDWFYHELHTLFSYQIKLRDTGTYGFLLPEEYIVPSGKEMFESVKYFCDFLMGNNGRERMIVGEKESLLEQEL